MSKSLGSAQKPGKGSSGGGKGNTGSGSSGATKKAPPAPAGKPATGKPAATGTQVTNLNKPEFAQQQQYNNQTFGETQRNLNAQADFLERMDRNVYTPKQQRELASEERKTDRNASAQEKVAALQAQASMFGSAEQTKQSKEQAEAQKHAASASASATKDAARSQADAQKFAANVDAAARQFDTKTKGRTEFSGLLANLAASVGNRSGQSMSDIFNAATQAAGVASQNKDSDKDRMADMYKSIMATYNTGSGQFKYW